MKKATLLAAIVLLLLQNAGRAELFLTAEVFPNIGLEGLSSYRISATSDLGSIVAFDFSDVASYGILGDLNQVSPLGEETIFKNALSQDTQFLVHSNDVISLFTKESTSYLHGTMAFKGDQQLTASNSLPFVQLATSNASSVNLHGMFVVRRPNGELVQSPIDVALPNIPIGPPPSVTLLPIPDPIPDPLPQQPPGPIVQPPIDIPLVAPPIVPPPVVNPPIVDPLPPVDYSTGAVARIGHGQLYLTAEVMPSLGRDGFNTYRITASSDIGNVVGVDFTKGGSKGISGPLGQVNPSGQPTVFTDENYQFNGIDTSQDSQFLFNSTKVISLFGEESDSALHAAFALMGDNQLTVGQSLPFVQVSTSGADQVTLNGAFAVRLPDGSFLETNVNMPLSNVVVGPAPTLPLLPIPEPIITPPAQPPVVAPEPGQTPPPDPQYPTHPDLPPDDNGSIVVDPPVENPDWDPNAPVDPDDYKIPDEFKRPTILPWYGGEILGRPVYIDPTHIVVLPLQAIDWSLVGRGPGVVHVFSTGCGVGVCELTDNLVPTYFTGDAVPTAVVDSALVVNQFAAYTAVPRQLLATQFIQSFTGTSAGNSLMAGLAAQAPEPSGLLLVVIALSVGGCAQSGRRRERQV